MVRQRRRQALMDAVPIPDESVLALDDVAPGLAGLRILFVNVFGVAVGEAVVFEVFFTDGDAGVQSLAR